MHTHLHAALPACAMYHSAHRPFSQHFDNLEVIEVPTTQNHAARHWKLVLYNCAELRYITTLYPTRTRCMRYPYCCCLMGGRSCLCLPDLPRPLTLTCMHVARILLALRTMQWQVQGSQPSLHPPTPHDPSTPSHQVSLFIPAGQHEVCMSVRDPVGGAPRGAGVLDAAVGRVPRESAWEGIAGQIASRCTSKPEMVFRYVF
jgi:hypothetical protein